MQAEIGLAMLVPGWQARRRRSVLGVALLVVGVAVPVLSVVYAVATGRHAVAMGLDADVLGVVLLVGAAALIARVVALVELWVAAGRESTFAPVEIVALVAAVAVIAASTVALAEVQRARGRVRPVFVQAADVLFDADEPVATPSKRSAAETPATAAVATGTTMPTVATFPEPIVRIVTTRTTTTSTTTTSTTATLPPRPTRPESGIDPELLRDVTTVLLLGGDAGPGRSGLRTDSMMLFSLHRPTGRASLVSIPRDMHRLLFPPGSALEARHPYGYDGLTNAVYIDVQSHQQLRDSYAVDGVRPGIAALAEGIGYSLDVTIDDYVLVDMRGFLDLIDAVGGVTVTLTKAIPMPGNVPGAPTQYPARIGPGTIHMDGTTALGYARSRKGDSDFQRTRRQRDLLAALARQVSLTDLARSFGDVTSAVNGTVRTSLTPDELTDTLNVIGGETAIVESLGLVPPLVNIDRPDFQALAPVVGAIQHALVTGVPSGY
ncbi:MAG: LCP family protein [Ilumatobacteraceae bacterium]